MPVKKYFPCHIFVLYLLQCLTFGIQKRIIDSSGSSETANVCTNTAECNSVQHIHPSILVPLSLPVHRRSTLKDKQRQTTIPTHSHTPTGNLEFSIRLTCMFMENLVRTLTHTGRTCKLHRRKAPGPRPRIDPMTFLL